MSLTAIARSLPRWTEIRESASGDCAPAVIAGAVGALPGILIAALRQDLGRPIAVVVPDEKVAQEVLVDLRAAGLAKVFHAPAPALTPYQRIPPSLKSRRDEFSLLAALREPAALEACVLPARSLFTRLPSPDDLARLTVTLREGEEVSLPRLTARLTEIGYRRSDLVIETGDLAVRGGLFDVFPPDRDLPARIELDGDRIASIRVFDPDTQRSRERLTALTIAPFAASEESETARDLLAERMGRLPSEAERSIFAAAVESMPASWLDHARGALLVVIEPAAVESEIAGFAERLAADRDPDRDPFAPEELVHPRPSRSAASLETARLRFDRVGLSSETPRADSGGGDSGPLGPHGGSRRGVSRALESGEEVFVAVHPMGGPEKLRRFALEYELHVSSERRPGAAHQRSRRRSRPDSACGSRASPSTRRARSSAKRSARRRRGAARPKRSFRTCATSSWATPSCTAITASASSAG